MDDLSRLIKNIEDINTGRIWKRKDVKEKIFMCYKAILYEIAKLQVSDTSYARALIVKVFCNRFGLETTDLQELNINHKFWENNGFPENSSKSWDTAKEGDGVNIYTTDNNVDLEFTTPEITNQALGIEKFDFKMGIPRLISPSPYNPYIEPQMEAYHIDKISNLANTGNLRELEDMVNRLADFIADEIVKGLK